MHDSIIIFPRVALGSSHNSVNSPCSTPRHTPRLLVTPVTVSGIRRGLSRSRRPPRLSTPDPASCSYLAAILFPTPQPANSVSQDWKSDDLAGVCVVTLQLWPLSQKRSPGRGLWAARREQSHVEPGRRRGCPRRRPPVSSAARPPRLPVAKLPGEWLTGGPCSNLERVLH